jgi:2-phosphosulfolactate phosphatase
MQTATISWGPTGVREALARNDFVVVVDALRFSSTVTTAIANGFTVIPSSDPAKAEALSAETGIPIRSLSPLDFLNPRNVEEVILISPNGALCVETVPARNAGFIGCFLNARTLGRVLRSLGEREGRNVTLVAAGEAREDQYADLLQRRFAIEDYLACGLVFTELKLELSPEAVVCMRAWDSSRIDYVELIRGSISGKYLVRAGHDCDISHCVQKSIYETVPVIADGKIIRYDGS